MRARREEIAVVDESGQRTQLVRVTSYLWGEGTYQGMDDAWTPRIAEFFTLDGRKVDVCKDGSYAVPGSRERFAPTT
jgi:hypothetical protein